MSGRVGATTLAVLSSFLLFGLPWAPAIADHPGSDPCPTKYVEIGPGKSDYVSDCPPGHYADDTPGNGEGNAGGGTYAPSCEFEGIHRDFCDGRNPCFRNDPAAIQDPAFNGLDPDSKPQPDSHAVYWQCLRPNGSTYDRYYWSGAEPTQVTLEQAARQAVGRLTLPAFTIRHSPPIDTLVNLDTWWWADGPDRDTVIGSDAFGIRAVATPDRIEVDPGDGTDGLVCPFVNEESDACSHTYERSSRTSPTDDDHAYAARMRLVYSIHFTHNGHRLTIPGAPTELPSVWETTQISVKEAQAVVVPNRRR